MENFDYGLLDKRDRPPPILSKHLTNDRLAGSAAQKLVLFRLFPLIFHDIISLFPSIRVYQLLREIVELVLAYPFRKSWLPHLRDLCTEFHRSILTCFRTKMTPKIHFCAEYAQIIEDYGPCTRYWCMRYESRHAYFKQVAFRANNYKNIALTLANRYQLRQCLLLSKSIFYNSVNAASGSRKTRESNLNDRIKALLYAHFGPIDVERDLFECTTLWHDHIEYTQSCVYVIGLEGLDERPSFAQVVRIVRVKTDWIFILDRLRTNFYNGDLCAWEIETEEEFALLSPQQLKYFHKGLDVYVVDQSSYVSLSSRMTGW